MVVGTSVMLMTVVITAPVVMLSPFTGTVNQAKTKDKNQDADFETPDEALDDAIEKAGDLGDNPQVLTDEQGRVIGMRSADGKRGWRIDDTHVNWWETDQGTTNGGHNKWKNRDKVPNATDAQEQFENGVPNGRGTGSGKMVKD